MTFRYRCPATMLLIAAVVAPAHAQQSPAPARPIEVTPFVALGSPGASPIGVGISFPVTSALSIEAEVGYRRGEGHIHALRHPYLAAGAGLAEFGAPIIGPDGRPIATQPMVAVVVNAGGGLKVPVDDSWGMRTDARWYKSFGRHGGEQWRVSQGVSFGVGR